MNFFLKVIPEAGAIKTLLPSPIDMSFTIACGWWWYKVSASDDCDLVARSWWIVGTISRKREIKKNIWTRYMIPIDEYNKVIFWFTVPCPHWRRYILEEVVAQYSKMMIKDHEGSSWKVSFFRRQNPSCKVFNSHLRSRRSCIPRIDCLKWLWVLEHEQSSISKPSG